MFTNSCAYLTTTNAAGKINVYEENNVKIKNFVKLRLKLIRTFI